MKKPEIFNETSKGDFCMGIVLISLQIIAIGALSKSLLF